MRALVRATHEPVRYEPRGSGRAWAEAEARLGGGAVPE
jgi:hypothetical protein